MTSRLVPVDGIDLAATLSPLALLRDDPTVRISPGRFDRATVTPDGPGAVSVTWPVRGDSPHDRQDAAPVLAGVRADGDGAAWLLSRAPRLLGCEDDSTGFRPAEPPLRDLWRRHRGGRITATATLWHDLAWTIVQQRVHRLDAAKQWRRLVLTHGAPAPGESGLTAPPTPEVVARLAYPRLHALGIERQRAHYLVSTARAVTRLQHLVDQPVDHALPALQALRGVGAWTIGCLSAFTWGDPDTVILGDAGIPAMITWLLARDPRGGDDRMLELLRPYRPHRYRVLKLAFAARSFPPRRHPRGARTDIRRL